MAAQDTLEQLHRLLNLIWQTGGNAADKLSINEFSYLRTIERLNGQGVCKTHGEPLEASGHGGPHLTDLAKEMGVRRASASSMLSKLEKNGYIQRLDCQHDARAQHIMITPEGRTYVADGAALYDELASALFGDLRVSELEQMNTRIRDRINSKLLEHAEG